MLPYFKGYLQQILSKEDMVVTWRFGSTLWGIYIFTSFISVNQKIFTSLSNNLNTSSNANLGIICGISLKYLNRKDQSWFFSSSLSTSEVVLEDTVKQDFLQQYWNSKFKMPTWIFFFPPLAVKRFFFSKGTFEDVAYKYTSFWIEEDIQHEQQSILKRVWFEKFYTTFYLPADKSVLCWTEFVEET